MDKPRNIDGGKDGVPPLISHCNVGNEDEGIAWEKLYDSGDFSDVSFTVGTELRIFKAHWAVLMSGSQKFEEMKLPLQNDEPIVIPDVEANVFEQLLK